MTFTPTELALFDFEGLASTTDLLRTVEYPGIFFGVRGSRNSVED